MKTIKQLEKEIEEERIRLKSVDVKKLNMEELTKLNDYIEIIMDGREIEGLKNVLKLIDEEIKFYEIEEQKFVELTVKGIEKETHFEASNDRRSKINGLKELKQKIQGE